MTFLRSTVEAQQPPQPVGSGFVTVGPTVTPVVLVPAATRPRYVHITASVISGGGGPRYFDVYAAGLYYETSVSTAGETSPFDIGVPGQITILPATPTDVFSFHYDVWESTDALEAVQIALNGNTKVKIVDSPPAGKVRVFSTTVAYPALGQMFGINTDIVLHTYETWLSADNGASFTLLAVLGSYNPGSAFELWALSLFQLRPGESVWINTVEPTATVESSVFGGYLDVRDPLLP